MRTQKPTPVRLAAIAAAAALLLAGCAPSAPGGADEQGGASDGGRIPAAEGQVTYPLTIETAWGETVLEERPERIVGLGAIDTELLVALGVSPVATSATIERAPWVTEAMSLAPETVFDWGGFPDGSAAIESVAAAAPDLIVAYAAEAGQSFERLAAIAPVLSFAEEPAAGEQANWRDALAEIAAVVDLSGAAEDATAECDEFFASARAANPEFAGLTATLLLQYSEESGTVYSSVPGSDQERLLTDLGFVPNPLARQFGGGESTVSPELIAQIDADVLIVASANPDPEDVDRLLTGTELFQQVGAVRGGNWAIFYGTSDGTGYVFDGVERPGNINWALAHGGAIIGKPWAAEQLVPILRSALAAS